MPALPPGFAPKNDQPAKDGDEDDEDDGDDFADYAGEGVRTFFPVCHDLSKILATCNQTYSGCMWSYFGTWIQYGGLLSLRLGYNDSTVFR